MWAILPVKDFTDAKQRLSAALTPHERRGLFAAMVEDVLAALAGCGNLFDGVLLITRDARARALADRYGARCIEEPANRGQTAAVTLGAQALASEGVRSILAVPGDIPGVTSAEIRAAVAAHGAEPAMTIVPAWDERGSNCIICSPPDLIPFSFGNDSFLPHLAAARAAGVEPHIVRLPGIGLDVDNPGDLRALLARPDKTRAHAFLEQSGIAVRLGETREPVGG